MTIRDNAYFAQYFNLSNSLDKWELLYLGDIFDHESFSWHTFLYFLIIYCLFNLLIAFM